MEDTKEVHRVHFDENRDLAGKNNEIVIQQKDGKLNVHLGFLQVKHRYSISFSVPISFWQKNGDCGEIVLESPTPKPFIEITNAMITQDTIDFQLELFPFQEKLLSEEFCFSLSKVKEPITVILNARVLGKGKGTPLLKNGIHLIHEPLDGGDSDTSSN